VPLNDHKIFLAAALTAEEKCRLISCGWIGRLKLDALFCYVPRNETRTKQLELKMALYTR
jgi:hypothetical protein